MTDSLYRYQFASGRNAYLDGRAFKPDETEAWRNGWRDARSRFPLLHPETKDNPP